MSLIREGPMDLLKAPAEVITIPVNTVGVMGKGLALYAKKRWPKVFEAYVEYCKSGLLEIGVPVLHANHRDRAILLFPTKKHWRDPSKLEYIEDGLKYLVTNESDFGFSSIAFPPLGCGNGGLDYPTQVKPVLIEYLEMLHADAYICF